MDYELPEYLKEMMKGLMDLYDLAYDELRQRVIYIIKNNIRDMYMIEHTLDDIMNIPTDKCYKLFVLLCEYVQTFDKEVALDYLDIYNDLYGDDESTITKK